MKTNKIILFLIIITLGLGCDKVDNPDKIELNYQYKGNFSIVVGHSFITLEQTGTNLDPNWMFFPDSLLRLVDTIKFTDAIPFDLYGIVGQKQFVKSIRFIGNASNEFPTYDLINFYFADQNEDNIDSIDPYKLSINPATFINDSTYDRPGSTNIDMPFAQSVFNRWNEISYIIISGEIVNNITKFSQFNYYHKFKINISLAVQVEFDFNLHELDSTK